MYSLIKFLFAYRDVTFLQKLFLTNSLVNSKEIISYLKTFLGIVINKIEWVKRKKIELSALRQLLYILEQCTIKDAPYTKYTWNYRPIFNGFNLLLEERGIDQKQVNLIIDNEKNTYKAAKDNSNYGCLQQGDSKYIVGIRLSDILSNFIGRILVALDRDLREAPIRDSNTLQNFDYGTKKILNPRWFILSESKYMLYKKINELLVTKQKYFWTIYTGVFFDYVDLFFSLIRYVGDYYPTYYKFNAVTAQQHSECFNTYSVNVTLNHFKEFYKHNDV
ncbi:hypothetical protein [Clostridium estertheticum]|nr:hypothetical protein [Clostridium estertheticum]MBX4270335.1 hypothetical protein [Clostridium estertheticum]